MTEKNYGFTRDRIAPEHYVLGGGNLSRDTLVEDGQWDAFLPPDERQASPLFDTYSCTSFGTLNALETLMRRLYGHDMNYSDRFLGIAAGTRPPGNSPHVVAEALRKDGCLPEDMLPFSDSLSTVLDYYSFKGGAEALCRQIAAKFTSSYDFCHSWMWDDPSISEARKRELIAENLKRSPVCVSVTAWSLDDSGHYVDNGQPNNHWCMCYGYVETDSGTVLKIYDSYDDSRKLLHPEHRIELSKYYHLSERELGFYEENPSVDPRKNWLTQLLQSLTSLVGDIMGR